MAVTLPGRVVAELERARAERAGCELIYRVVRPDGQVRVLEVHGQVSLDEQGEPVRLVGVCSDVTESLAADEAKRALAVETASAEAKKVLAGTITSSPAPTPHAVSAS